MTGLQKADTEICSEKRLLRKEGKDGYTEVDHKKGSK